MNKINFTKMVASGNDFVVIGRGQKALARKICDRKSGIGADGLLVLGKSKIADVRMRIFNADGSEAEMCGNGARCAALYTNKTTVKIETKTGIILSRIQGSNVKIKLTDPSNIRLNLAIKVNKGALRVNFINTGVPHTVIFTHGLEKISIVDLGRQIRYHKKFIPAGTNVDFVETLDNNSISVRTYERGVEDETLACGTGAVASALIYSILNTRYSIRKVNVLTRGKEILKVYFKKMNNSFKDVWLEGKARIVYTGVYYV